MNKIILNKPLLLNKKYIVYFDSENKFTFSNKRAANDFITHIGKQMDESVLFITEEFNHLEEFYRLYYLADADYKFKYTLNNSVQFINNRIEWIQSRRGSENHDAIVFHSIVNCLNELADSFNLMEEKAYQRRDTITKRRCSLKSNVIGMYLSNLLSTGIKPQRSTLILKMKA